MGGRLEPQVPENDGRVVWLIARLEALRHWLIAAKTFAAADGAELRRVSGVESCSYRNSQTSRRTPTIAG